MHHVIELHFDETTELRLNELTAKIRELQLDQSEEIPGIRPHITLASSEPLRLDAIGPKLEKLFSTFHELDIRLSSIGLFPKANGNLVMYLSPAESLMLCRWHSDLFRLLDGESAATFSFTRPGEAVFHVTIAHDLPKDRIVEANELVRSFLPHSAKVTRLAVVEYFPARELIIVPLSKTPRSY